MNPRRLQLALSVAVLVWPGFAWPQATPDLPLGDVARNIRKAKVTTKPAEVLVDNDNFSKVMESAESRRMKPTSPALTLGFGLGVAGVPFQPADVNCSLSFSAQGIRLADTLGPPPGKTIDKQVEKDKKEAVVDSAVPASELAKLEGPAAIIGDSLQLSVFNGSVWQIEEITVGLTILRHPSHAAENSGEGRVVPASSVQIVAKRSDTTIVYHFKGSAAPNSRATFTEPLGIALSPDQEWHWGIIDAKGTPPPKIGDLKPNDPKTTDSRANVPKAATSKISDLRPN